MRTALWLLAAAFVALSLDGARLEFKRVVPAGHRFDAPSDRIALLQMDGTADACSHVFLRIELREAVEQTGAKLEDVSHLKVPVSERRASVEADLYLESESCSCRTAEHPRADDIPWYSAACQASFRLTDASGRDLGLLTVKGKAEDKFNVGELIAQTSAGKMMMHSLVRLLRPHERTLVIDTDRKVPGEKEAARLIRKKDFAGARAVWERELANHPDHAGLHFSLAAAADAAGDAEAARHHYAEAVRLAPDEEKYARFKGYFEERTR